MGAKQTKIDGTYLPDTPTIQQIKLNRIASKDDEMSNKIIEFNEADPRSPSACRTPLNFAVFNFGQNKQVPSQQQQTPVTNQENPLGILRRRFLKNFVYNLNDPRSPSSELNRTPLIIDENDRTFSMDDTFADLFVESRVMPEEFKQCAPIEGNDLDDEEFFDANEEEKPVAVSENNTPNTSNEIVSYAYEDDETLPCSAILQKTPTIEQQEIDPRSPTYGVKRTPILFEDNEDFNEDDVIEQILATLSLNKSNDSSILSFGTPSGPESVKIDKVKPTNKHLERVRHGKKNINQGNRSGRSRRIRQRIYEDGENQENISTTPKLKKIESNNGEVKRTPLSCVKNRSTLRSRSVEMSEKSIKTRLSLSSFDDNLNPTQNANVINLHILQGEEEAMDF